MEEDGTSNCLAGLGRAVRTNNRLQVVKEPSAVLMIPNEIRIGQNSDHREIARFLSLHDRNFQPLLRRLEIFKNDIANQLKSPSSGSSPYGETSSSKRSGTGNFLLRVHLRLT